MRPLLASLALLLLALCRQSAGGISYSIQSFNTESSKTSVSFLPKDKKAAVTTAISKPKEVARTKSDFTPEKGVKLFELIPNTILFAAFSAAGIKDNIPVLMKSLYNGMLCDFKPTNLESKFNEVVYGHAVMTPEERLEEEKEFKNPPDGKGLDCTAAAPTDPNEALLFGCFCTERKAGLYCLFLTAKKASEAAAAHNSEAAQKPCRDVTVPALVASGPLGKLYDLDSFGQNGFDDAFSGKVDPYSTDEMKAILCDALNPTVENAVKAVYASDGLYWITESLLYSIVFGPPEKSLTQECEETDFKNPFGECVCKQDTGFTFCIYKVIAQAFKDAGYLTCGSAPAFVADKKPAALPQLAHKGSGASGSSSDKASATTFSLLAPAAAAAALLLRQ